MQGITGPPCVSPQAPMELPAARLDTFPGLLYISARHGALPRPGTRWIRLQGGSGGPRGSGFVVVPEYPAFWMRVQSAVQIRPASKGRPSTSRARRRC